MIEYLAAAVLFTLILITPRAYEMEIIKSVVLTLIISFCFFSINPIAGYGYAIIGGLLASLRLKTLYNGKINLLPVKYKSFYWKVLGLLCVLGGVTLIQVCGQETQQFMADDLTEQDLMTLIILLFGLGSLGIGGKEWKR